MPTYSTNEFIKLIRPIPKNWKLDKYGIPFIKKSNIDITNINNGKWLININNTTTKDKYSYRKIIHSFKENNILLNYYNNPYKFLKKASRYYAVSTFDFSMHSEMQKAQIIEATFMNRWSGVWLQMNGVEKVAVTVGWVNDDTYDICFSGIEDGTLLLISTLGAKNNCSETIFIKGYKEMRKRFPSSQIICIGNRIKGMDDDVCYVKYKDSFGNWDKYKKLWQPSLFNWNLTEVDLNGIKR